jgi:hypothetical protein
MSELEGPDGLFGNVPSTDPNVSLELWNQLGRIRGPVPPPQSH